MYSYAYFILGSGSTYFRNNFAILLFSRSGRQKINEPNEWVAAAERTKKKSLTYSHRPNLQWHALAMCVYVYVVFGLFTLCATRNISSIPCRCCYTFDLSCSSVHSRFFPRSTFSCLIRVDAHVVAQYLVFTLLSPVRRINWSNSNCVLSVYLHMNATNGEYVDRTRSGPRKRTHLPYLLLCMNLSFPAIMQNM